MPDTPSAATTQPYSARAKTLHWARAVLVLLMLAGVHMAAALYHHFIAKDIMLARMWPRAKLP